MKKLLIVSILIVLVIAACDLGRRSTQIENFSELVQYSAASSKTQFTYRLTLGDTVQMALARDVVYVTATQKRDGLHVSVIVDHVPTKSKK
jgi:hypothetical protein